MSEVSLLSVEVVDGDLLLQAVEVIVNSWNQNFIPHWLLLTQGVSGAIKKKGGTAPFKELRKAGVLSLGSAHLTGAGKLPFKGIIHVAGINHFWRSSEYSVRHSVKNALAIASNRGFGSIAFPAIGAGSSIRITHNLEWPLWGVTTQQSIAFICDEVNKSSYRGRVLVVRYKKTDATLEAAQN